VATRSKRPIATEEIPRIFDDACIEELAQIGKLPASADMKRFAEGIREAARLYAIDVREPNDNEVRAEVEKLYLAAERRLYDQVANLLEKLSPRALRLLKHGGWTTTIFPWPGPQPLLHQPRIPPPNLVVDESRRRRPTSIHWTSTTVPSPETLRDRARREEACATVVKLCQYGGHWVQSRKRPSGKRSWSWRPYIRAPEPRRHFPKREAERTFVMWLRTAWVEATDEVAPRTADPGRPGPFARMVRECLILVGAGHAVAIGLLNELNQIRREMSRRSALPPLTPNKS
jgi:hypothetical protein